MLQAFSLVAEPALRCSDNGPDCCRAVRASRYAVIGVAAVITVTSGRCTSAAVAVGGLTPHAVRAPSVEKALVDQVLSAETIAKAAAQVHADLGDEILGDVFASAGYRAAVAPVWVKRAITAAADRAK